jgi:hypothetical protein
VFLKENLRIKFFFQGLVNSGYRVRGKNDDQEWTEIGRRSPQLPTNVLSNSKRCYY